MNDKTNNYISFIKQRDIDGISNGDFNPTTTSTPVPLPTNEDDAAVLKEQIRQLAAQLKEAKDGLCKERQLRITAQAMAESRKGKILQLNTVLTCY